MSYNERTVNIIFRPFETKDYTDTITLESEVFAADMSLYFTGTGILTNYEVQDNNGSTWDILSFLFFSTYDKILEIWQTNKHLSDTEKKSFCTTSGATLLIPVLDEQEKAEIKNASTNLTPPWKR